LFSDHHLQTESNIRCRHYINHMQIEFAATYASGDRFTKGRKS